MSNASSITYFASLSDVEDLIRAFESGALPRERWTHHAHLAVGLWYLSHFPEEDAMEFIREGIKRYNLAVGIANTRTSGYHETITLAWARLVKHLLSEKSAPEDSLSIYHSLLSRFDDRNTLLRYYSRDRLMSDEARATWVEPDLLPLPGSIECREPHPVHD
jgi:hypothetical protein